MLQKNLQDSDVKSVSTKMTAPTKAASFSASAKRQMFKQVQAKNKLQQKLHNYLSLNPEAISAVSVPQIHMLENGESYVLLNDGHYTYIAGRSKPYMLARNSESHSCLLFSNARMPGSFIFFESLETYKIVNRDMVSKAYIHINITKYNPQNHELQVRDVHAQVLNKQQLISFITLQNSKKGLYLSKMQEEGRKYRLVSMSLKKNNKSKNPKYRLQPKESNDSEKEQDTQNEFVYGQVDLLDDEFELEEGEQFIKMINSQFGDSVLVITNYNIYQVEFEAKNIYLKSLDIKSKLNKYLNQIHKGEKVEKDELRDAVYIKDGLKIIFLTKSGYIGYIDTEQIKMLNKIQEIMGNNTNTNEVQITNIHSLVGRVMVLAKNHKIILFKQSQNTLSYEKSIQLLMVNRPQVQTYACKAIPKTDQILLSMVTKRETLNFQVYKKNVLSTGNEFTQLTQSFYHDIKVNDTNVQYENAKANGINCILEGHELKIYRFYEGFASQKKEITQLFTTSFFQKPLTVSIDPYGSNIVILFREFMKIYKFQYQNIVAFYTLNIRNINYAGYTNSGQYILVVKEDRLYFVNPFSLNTQKVIDMYGDVKNIYFYDTKMYVLIKTKNNMKMLYIYRQKDGQYNKVEELKLTQNQSYYEDKNRIIVCSNKLIKVWNIQEQEILYNQTHIKLQEQKQCPTAVKLVEDLGYLLIGTNKGKLYQYLWPFTYQSIIHHISIHVSQSEILKINPSVSNQKIYVYTKNKSIIQYGISQMIDGQEMPNLYVINPKTLYTQTLKYQFSNKEYFYQPYTSYIAEYRIEKNEGIDELQFMNEKKKDDLQEFKVKHKLNSEQEIKNIKNRNISEKGMGKQELNKHKNKSQEQMNIVNEQLKQMQSFFNEKKEKQVQKYEKTLLDLYRESDRLKSIYKTQNSKLTLERDQLLIKHDNMIKTLQVEQDQNVQVFKKRYSHLQENAQVYNKQIEKEKEKGEVQLKTFKQIMKEGVQRDFIEMQAKKQSLLGSMNYFEHEIANCKKRRDEFEALIKETLLQIQDLSIDQKQYQKKKNYLVNELKIKQQLIQQKQHELVKYVKNTSAMKKTKQIHAFELEEYRKEIAPVTLRMTEIDTKIKKMNSQILQEFNRKVQTLNEIELQKQKQIKLKKDKERAILGKHVSQTRFLRFVEELTPLLDDPLNRNIKHKLLEMVMGQKYEINKDQIKYKNANLKLVRRKNFIRKQLEENQKKEQHIVKNKNEFFKHYNENTLLLREYQDLKQTQKQLLAKKQQIEHKIQLIKQRQMLTPKKRTRSVLNFQKTSQKIFTPYQKHQEQFNDMFRKNTILTKASSSKGQSLSFLKSLMKQMKGSESRYEKMQLIRERVRSYVNPELTATKTFKAQKLIFDEKK